MMKKMLLCVGLMGLFPSNVQAAADSNPVGVFDILLKGGVGLVGAVWAYERLKNSYDDWKNDNPQPATFLEDVKNVSASIACTMAVMYVGGATVKQVAGAAVTGGLIGATYLGLKQSKGAENLRLRAFVPAIAAYTFATANARVLGAPTLSWLARS